MFYICKMFSDIAFKSGNTYLGKDRLLAANVHASLPLYWHGVFIDLQRFSCFLFVLKMHSIWATLRAIITSFFTLKLYTNLG